MNQDNSEHEERRLRLEEARFALENSFARKYLPILATFMVGIIAAMFSYVQQQNSIEETKRTQIEANAKDERTRIEAKAKDEREWGYKVIGMYFEKRELFDLTKNPKDAGSNLKVLAAVAPIAVLSVLNEEKSKIPLPTTTDDTSQIASLVAVTGVQDALTAAVSSKGNVDKNLIPSDFTVYLQYPGDNRETAIKAQGLLSNQGFHVPGMEEVKNVPSHIQVRYYRPEQKAFAEQLVIQLGKELNLPASASDAVLLVRNKKLPTGIIELWLPVTTN